jgi:ABC-2 type transport system ATP-binding protein
MNAVAARDVRKEYGDTAALDGVSIDVPSGESFALVGPNGAGKTTLIRCLTGTESPDDGEVSLLGGPPGDADPQRLGLLPQSFSPAGRLSARELVAHYAGLYDSARAPGDALDAVGLDPASRDTAYENLSGGQQRRACVAATLVNDPDVLFLDEPTASVDPAGRRALHDALADLVAGGTTLVLTTHDMAEAERLADRVGFLAAGRLVAVGTPSGLVAEHAGGPRLLVETGADVGSVAGFEARATDEGIELRNVARDDVADVVRALDAEGVPFDAIEWSEPDLEDAYLALTGGSE